MSVREDIAELRVFKLHMTSLCEIWVFHADGNSSRRLLGCDVV
jgi:hypothetical protein